MKNIDASTIAARAGKGFYKSYVKNIRLAEKRAVSNHVKNYVEKDYIFDYKGKTYRVNQHIVPNAEGEVKYSAEYRYETKEI